MEKTLTREAKTQLASSLRRRYQAASSRAKKTTPGWISASVHRSRDGARVVNYAQCESMEAALRVIDRLREGGWLERNKAFGEAHLVCTT